MEEHPLSSSSSSSFAGASTSRNTLGGAAATATAAMTFERFLEQNHEIGTSYGGNMSLFDEVSTVITADTWRGPASSSSSLSGSSVENVKALLKLEFSIHAFKDKKCNALSCVSFGWQLKDTRINKNTKQLKG
ncbi:hypothetical protein C1H46_036404 [Malus baccata]|uniref:Uncharacterized protein n=1 Tax=Malus baccata TaxID=106549 RepID=A0A540KVM9_MALBA|nr:hypothetical protein C1H46_036404 [Malus baccata]